MSEPVWIIFIVFTVLEWWDYRIRDPLDPLVSQDGPNGEIQIKYEKIPRNKIQILEVTLC